MAHPCLLRLPPASWSADPWATLALATRGFADQARLAATVVQEMHTAHQSAGALRPVCAFQRRCFSRQVHVGVGRAVRPRPVLFARSQSRLSAVAS